MLTQQESLLAKKHEELRRQQDIQRERLSYFERTGNFPTHFGGYSTTDSRPESFNYPNPSSMNGSSAAYPSQGGGVSSGDYTGSMQRQPFMPITHAQMQHPMAAQYYGQGHYPANCYAGAGPPGGVGHDLYPGVPHSAAGRHDLYPGVPHSAAGGHDLYPGMPHSSGGGQDLYPGTVGMQQHPAGYGGMMPQQQFMARHNGQMGGHGMQPTGYSVPRSYGDEETGESTKLYSLAESFPR